jgi:DNA-binding NarL/FixJ family response regulator
MAVLIFEKSAEVTERLIELILHTDTERKIYHTNLYKNALGLLYRNNIKTVVLGLAYGETISIEFFKTIKLLNEKTKIIIMHTWADEKSLRLCKEKGADYIFNKYSEFQNIPDAIAGLHIAY